MDVIIEQWWIMSLNNDQWCFQYKKDEAKLININLNETNIKPKIQPQTNIKQNKSQNKSQNKDEAKYIDENLQIFDDDIKFKVTIWGIEFNWIMMLIDISNKYIWN